MKKFTSGIILATTDLFTVLIALYLAYTLRVACDSWIDIGPPRGFGGYAEMLTIYIIPLFFMYAEGIYTKRYDFWQESRRIIKALLLAFMMVMAILALSKEATNYSRFVLSITFLILLIILPTQKYFLKRVLFKIGLWQRKAKVYGNDTYVTQTILENPYLGYVDSGTNEPQTVFVNSVGLNTTELNGIIDQEIKKNHEVVFIPFLNSYDFTLSDIHHSFKSRTNFILLRNRLKSGYRVAIQQGFNYFLAVLLLPILLPLIGIIGLLIKRESSGPIFFAHHRIGKGGVIIPTYKFRSMYSDAQERLERLIATNEEIKKEWENNFKLKNDPRVTKIGAFLRKTSLDELPQIFNVLKGEMNFVGPRPVVQKEIDLYYKENSEYYYMVKPGITGLWQVSGRSDTDYDFRVSTDKWYVINWSLWLDIAILFKTVKVVLRKEGAY